MTLLLKGQYTSSDLLQKNERYFELWEVGKICREGTKKFYYNPEGDGEKEGEGKSLRKTFSECSIFEPLRNLKN